MNLNKEEKKKFDHIVSEVARLESERKDLNDQVKELCDKAKEDLGVFTKVTRQLAKEKNWNEIERLNQRCLEEQLDAARSALGLLADLPLGEAALSDLERAPSAGTA